MNTPHDSLAFGRNSSVMSNKSFGAKVPTTFLGYLWKLCLRFSRLLYTGYDRSKSFVWYASIGT